MCFHRHFKVFCLDLKPKTHQNNINSDFIGLLGFVCNFYFVKFAQICCADSIALAREHGIERKHCARLFTLAFVRFNFNLAHLPFGFVNSAAKCYHSTSQPVSQPSFDSCMGGYATSIYAQFCMLNSHIFFFFACDFNFYDGVVRRSYYAFAPAQCNVPLFLFIVAQLVSVIVDYCVVIIRLKHIFWFLCVCVIMDICVCGCLLDCVSEHFTLFFYIVCICPFLHFATCPLHVPKSNRIQERIIYVCVFSLLFLL